MAQHYVRCVGMCLVLAFSSPTFAQPVELEAIRKQRAELEKELVEKKYEFEQKLLKQRAELEQKLKGLEKEMHEAFNVKHGDLAKRLLDVQRLEKSLERTLEAKDKGFYARLEIKGRLYLSDGSDLIPPMPRFNAMHMIAAGDVSYRLVFKAGPTRQTLIELADQNSNRTVIITGELTSRGLEVLSLKANKE